MIPLGNTAVGTRSLTTEPGQRPASPSPCRPPSDLRTRTGPDMSNVRGLECHRGSRPQAPWQGARGPHGLAPAVTTSSFCESERFLQPQAAPGRPP